MRRAVIAAIVVLLAVPALGADGGRWPWAHTRWGNEPGRVLLAEGARRSALIRQILTDLDRTDVIVHVAAGMQIAEPAAPPAHLEFVAAAGKLRYLRVTVNTWRAGEWDAIPLLGHELQHALEVAGAADVRDLRTFERLYYRIGWRTGAGAFETELARTMGRRVQEELLWAKRVK